MKKFKLFLFLLVLIALGILFSQNYEYFTQTNSLRFDLKAPNCQWTIPAVPNIAFFGICFLAGLIVAGVKWMTASLSFRKIIKGKDADILSLNEKINTLKTQLEVFEHDPYIKKALEKKSPELEKTKSETDADADAIEVEVADNSTDTAPADKTT